MLFNPFYNAGKPKTRSRKRKLLKADQLLLPESKIKPVGSKKRKVNDKNRQAENPSDSPDSDVEEDRNRPVAVHTNNNEHKTLAAFDLWETQGTCSCNAVQLVCSVRGVLLYVLLASYLPSYTHQETFSEILSKVAKSHSEEGLI